MKQTQWTIEQIIGNEVYIKCDNLQQRNAVIEKLESFGCSLWLNKSDNELFIITFKDCTYSTMLEPYPTILPIINYSDFITSKN